MYVGIRTGRAIRAGTPSAALKVSAEAQRRDVPPPESTNDCVMVDELALILAYPNLNSLLRVEQLLVSCSKGKCLGTVAVGGHGRDLV